MHVRLAAIALLTASAALIPSHASAQLSLGRLIVTITAPNSGATVSGMVPFSASVSIVGALTVRSVEFKVNGVVIAEDTSAPYSIPWNTRTVGNGSRQLTVTARDLLGIGYDSQAVTVTVMNDLTPPSVTMSAPVAGETVSGNVTASADASDNVGVAGVRFTLDGSTLGAEDTTAPYSVAWDTTQATDGTHTLAAIARDAAGSVTTSAGVSVRVDNTPPQVAITDPAAGTTASGSITIAATASDSSGIAGVQFMVDGANLGGEDTSAPYSIVWDTTGATNGSHTIAALARDAFGRTMTSAPVTIQVSNVTETQVRIEDTNAAIAFAGSWALGNTAKAWSGGTAALATGGPSATGTQTRATLTFTGTAVKWVGFRGPQMGIARVYLDGNQVATIDSYATAEEVGAVLYQMSGLAAVTHTLAVEATGTRNPAASDIFVVVDAFDVTSVAGGGDPPPPPSGTATRYEDLDSAIVYTPGSVAAAPPNWWHGSRSRGWSGETSSFNRSEGARATFTFTGTSVTWIGFRANWAGIARVFVDGVFAEELDLYSVTERPQAPVFTSSTLSAGTHTITVESTGRTNASATDNAVVVDAFDVTPGTPPRVSGARIEESSGAVSLTSGWTAAAADRAWSGGAALTASTAGARAAVTFTGNTVSLIGQRSPRSGIARIYLDGAFHATVDMFASTDVQAVIFTETNLASGTHELIVEATGLKNAAATDSAIVVDAFDVRTLVEEVDSAVTYSGTWSPQNFDEKWSGTSPNYGSGSATRSVTPGARAEFMFAGTGVRWIGFRGPAAGIARVYIDGVPAGDVDAYAPVKEVQAEMFSASGLSAGTHTMTIEVTGQRNAAASNSIVVVDAFEVSLPASMPAVARSQQADAAYPAGSWEQSSANPLFSGTTIAFSSTPGARAEFTFIGTGIRWIGQRGFGNGIARVYLDGVAVADVDSYAAIQEEFQAPTFSTAGLAAGTHTLSIEVLGTKNPASSGTRIVIDAFDVIR